MRQKLTLSLLVLGLTIVVLAETGDDGSSSVRGLVEAVIKDFDTSCKDADKQYEKKIAPVIKRHNLKRCSQIHTAGKEAMRKLKKIAVDAQKNESPVGEALAKDGMAYVDKVMGESEIPIPIGEVWRVKFEDHRYLAVMAPITWEQAINVCKKMGGHLVYIDSQDELDFLVKLTKGSAVFVGATDKQKEGDWRWLNGRKVSRSLWFPNRPLKSKLYYASILVREGMLDVPDEYSGSRGFICEWDK